MAPNRAVHAIWATATPGQAWRADRLPCIEALDWERRSGATFEAEKTAIIHFTRTAYKTTTEPFTIKGRVVQPKDHVKILGGGHGRQA